MSKNASSTATTNPHATIVMDEVFHEGLFKISDGINPQEKLEQASLFLDAAHEGIDEMVSIGEANIRTLWGYAHMIETAKALVDSANREIAKGRAA